MMDLTADFLASQVLNVQVPIFTGPVQTDKLHVHKLYLRLKLFTHESNIQLLPIMNFYQAVWFFVHYLV
jgi:hypothetical protein